MPMPRFLVRNARIELGKDAGFSHQPDINSKRSPPKIQGWHGEIPVFGAGDLIHLHGGIDGTLRVTTHKFGDGRRSSHGKTSITSRLGNGAVADIRVGIICCESR